MQDFMCEVVDNDDIADDSVDGVEMAMPVIVVATSQYVCYSGS